MGVQMKNEFKRGDVLAKIGEPNEMYIVKSFERDGYICDYYINRIKYTVGAWVSFKAGNDRMVKVDEWDFGKDKPKGVDGQEKF